jgi:hypothetical protein
MIQHDAKFRLPQDSKEDPQVLLWIVVAQSRPYSALAHAVIECSILVRIDEYILNRPTVQDPRERPQTRLIVYLFLSFVVEHHLHVPRPDELPEEH